MQALPKAEHLVRLADDYAAAVGRSESRISELATGNPHAIPRMRRGGGCTVDIYSRALVWFAQHWLAVTPWPPGIPRPEPSPASEEKAA